MSGRTAVRLVPSAVVAAVVLATAAAATTHPIRGLDLHLRAPAPGAGSRRAVLRIRGADAVAGAGILAGDPVRQGATLTLVVTGASGGRQTFTLPAGRAFGSGPGWRVRRGRAPGRGAFVYRDPGAVNGPVVLLRLEHGRRAVRLDLRVVANARRTPSIPGSADTGSAQAAFVLRPPNPGTGGGLFVTVPGGEPYCVAFGGLAGGTVRPNDASRFRVRRAERAACPDMPGRAPFVAFESEPVRSLALSPDGRRLFAVNTPAGRLELLAVGPAGDLTPAGSVAVGLEPVAVAAPTDREVWVVNHLSDSISVVDVEGTPPRVVRTILTCDEPRDLVFAGTRAFVTTARRGQNCISPDGTPIDPKLTTPGTPRALVQVFDASQPGASLGGTPAAVVELFGDTPRALAVSPAGDTVYAAIFRSGNQTTTVHEQAVCDGGQSVRPCLLGDLLVPGGLPAPNPNSCHGEEQPETGLVVRYDPRTAGWLDAAERDWRNAVRFTLPDLDVFAIDATASPPRARRSWSGVGTVLFNMVANPRTGAVYVSNTEADNRTRFEGSRAGSCVTSTLRGHLHEARITVLDETGVRTRHLNPHLEPYDVAPSAADKARSLATPLALATDGTSLWVAAFGSSTVAALDVAGLEAGAAASSPADHVVVSGGGPSGLVLAGSRLYVATRFDNGVSVVDTAARREIAHLTLHDPEPASVTAGRRILYDAVETSDNGEASCAACHVFGDLDGLSWDLGDPDGRTAGNPNPFELVAIVQDARFRTLKGPMATQSLRGLAGHGPLHWRGDRTGAADPGGTAGDTRAAFAQFNPAFVSLLGRGAPLSPEQMRAFTEFVMQITYPPNPIRSLDGALTPEQANGRRIYFDVVSDGARTCNGCHRLDAPAGRFGTDGDSSFDREPQVFKIPHLRNAYQKVGMFGLPPLPTIRATDGAFLGDQIRGGGFLHDGSVDTIARFLSTSVFSLSTRQARDVEAFVLAFDGDLAPIVGQQVTLTAGNAAAAGPRIDLMLGQAAQDIPACDVTVHGVVDGLARGWVRLPSGDFGSDRGAESPLADAALRAQAAVAGQERTYTCVPPGSGPRLGVDRDQDGCLDGDDPAPEHPGTGCAG